MNPAANPPASQPPPPPSGSGDNNGEEGEASATDPLIPPKQPSSYQHGGDATATTPSTSGSSSSRAAAPPTIRHYGAGDGVNGNENGDVRDFFFVRGDATLTPNTGETNSYDTAIFGLALHELLEYVRLANMIAALVALGLLITSWFMRLMTGQVSKLVLSCYLAFLSMVLMMVEIVSMWHFVKADEWLKDNFGIVRYPVGKSVFIYLLSSICFSIGGIPEFVLGGLYFVCASLVLYVWCSYPEFRRQFQLADEAEDAAVAAAAAGAEKQPPVTWSDFSTTTIPSSLFKSATGKSLGETASLLGSKFKS